MPTAIRIRISPDLMKRAVARYQARLPGRLEEAVKQAGAMLLRRAVPRAPRRTGFLRASLTPNQPYNIWELMKTGQGIVLRIGSNLPYAVRQEFDESLSHSGTARWYPHKVGRKGMKRGVFRGRTYQKVGGFGFLRKSLSQTKPDLVALVRVAAQGRG